MVSYAQYIDSCSGFVDAEIDSFKSWPIREMREWLIACRVNVRGLKPLERDRRKLLERFRRHQMAFFDREWSRMASAGKFAR